TPGPVEICTCLHGLYRVDIMAHEGRKSVATVVVKRPPVNRDMEAEDYPEGWANAHLIAEAFNVHHETGLTPRQLAEQRAEMIAALERLLRRAESLIAAGKGLPFKPSFGMLVIEWLREVAKEGK